MDERSTRIAQRLEWPMLVAALLVIPIVILEESGVGEPWRSVVSVADYVTWCMFLAELVIMLAVVPDRRAWLRQHPLEVLIVVLTPPFLGAGLEAVRALRLLRLLRLVRVARAARRLFSLEGIRYVAVLAALTVVAGGAAFASVEKDASTWDGIWWAMTTMTTVGYGDFFPETDAGRVIGMGIMLVGIGFLSVLIGAVGERFAAVGIAEEAHDIEVREAEVLREVRALAERLERIERALTDGRDRGV